MWGMLRQLLSWIPPLPQSTVLSPLDTSVSVLEGPESQRVPSAYSQSLYPITQRNSSPSGRENSGALWEVSPSTWETRRQQVVGGPGEEWPFQGQVSRYRLKKPQSLGP